MWYNIDTEEREVNNMTNLIDKRTIKLDTTFDDLEIGDFFQDTSNCIWMKTGGCSALLYCDGRWVSYHVEKDWLVIPLKVTITIEREEEKK